MTPHGLSNSKPIFNAGLIPTTSAQRVRTVRAFRVKRHTNDNVCPTSICQLFHSLIEAFSIGLKVPRFSAQRFCQIQARLYRIYCEEMLWFISFCIYHSTQPYRSALKSSSALLIRKEFLVLPATNHYHSCLSDFILLHIFESVVGRKETTASPSALDASNRDFTYVGKISAIRTNALSAISSGAFITVASASGMRTYSACAPSRAAVPKSIPLAHLEEKPCLQ